MAAMATQNPSTPSNPGTTASDNTASTKDMKPIIIGGSSLVAEYDKSKLAAQEKYTGKIVQTNGYIANISQDITGII